MKYYYFVCFSFAQSGSLGLGNLELSTNQEISSMEDISRLSNMIIAKDPTIQDLCIINYQLLRTEQNK